MQSARQSSRSTNAPSATSASSASTQESGTSNAFMASQLTDQTETTSEESMLGLTANSGPRVTGSAAAAFSSAFPDPDWAVVPGGKNGQRYTPDSVKVISHVTGTQETAPAWYEAYDKNNVGHVTGQAFGTALAFHLTASFGLKHCARIDPDTGDAEYFLIEYSPGVERDHYLLRDENGDGGLGLGLLRTVQAMKGVIDFLSPADNIIQAATNTNLDVFSDDFGESLGLRGQLLQLLQAGVECLAVGKAGGGFATFTTADRFAMGMGVGLAVGEPALKVLVDLGALSEEDSHYLLAVTKLVQTIPALNGILKSGLNLSDALTAIQSISQAGDEAAKAWLGEAGYKEYWEKNAGIIDESIGGLGNIKTIIDAVEQL